MTGHLEPQPEAFNQRLKRVTESRAVVLFRPVTRSGA